MIMKEGYTYMDKRLMRWQCKVGSIGCRGIVTLRVDTLNTGKYSLVMTPSSFLIAGFGA